jgi:three-Cys-motif partner protein
VVVAAKDEQRLFDPERDLLSVEEVRKDAAQALNPEEGKSNVDLDSARLWLSRRDGLIVRGVKNHSAKKSAMVSRAVDTVSTAMGSKWFAKEHGLEYLELYGGPGVLLDETTGAEQPGSPLQALAVRRPFDTYVFNDFSVECANALRERTKDHTNVQVVNGDANDATLLEDVAAKLNARALVIAYIDPARPRDLDWRTIRFLAERFPYGDLIINLPVNSLMRAILGASRAKDEQGAAGRFLNHPKPADLLRRSRSGKLISGSTIEAIRDYYDAQLIDLGFLTPARRVVDFPEGNPYYDVILVSRHPTGLELWNRTNPPPAEPQMSILDLLPPAE